MALTAVKTNQKPSVITIDERIAQFIQSLESYWSELEQSGKPCARIWAKILSKPVMTEEGEFMTDESGKIVREPIANKDGEPIDDSAFILSCTEQHAREFSSIASLLSGTGKYVSMDLFLTEDEELTFNFLKASYNDMREQWEILTTRKREMTGLKFSQLRRVHADEVPINL